MSKIARIGIDARLWNETGVGRYIRNLVQNLQKIDTKNEYILFVLSKDREVVQASMINDKWSIVEVNIRWHSVKEQLQFGKILEKENLDLVHFPYFSVPVLYKRPFVVTIHDLILHHFPTGKASTLPTPIYWVKQVTYRWVIAQAAKKAIKILTVSHATAQEIVDDLHVSDKKIVVTYEGVEETFRNSNARGNNELGDYFLYVGNAYPHKNLERLLEGFNEFRKTIHEEVKLVFVGKEDFFYKRLKEKVREMSLQEAVLFKQTISDEELSDLYQHAQALVVPSLMEGFGLPGLEAMSNNCLVVSSDIPALKEIYEDIAISFDPYSTKSIALSLENVYRMEEKEKVFVKAKGKEYIKKFSWKHMAAQTLDVYESCIGL